MTMTPPAPGDHAFRPRPRRAAVVQALDRLRWGGLRLAATASRWVLTAYRKNRILHAMEAKRDDELWDIGLRRDDLHDLAALPLGSDAGDFLTLRAAEGRRSLATTA